ncbi:MAG: hypothetical protein PQJ58_10475 [Spirochaetales bacterium]|nr:hypothetical protein [Spirochaetales bacterium]
MKKSLGLLILLLVLSGCTRYMGDRYTLTRRENIKLYDGSSLNTRIIRNNVWSGASFISDKLPKQKAVYEVFITDRKIIELLADEDFIQHIVDRVMANDNYDEQEREKALLLATTDLRHLFENPSRLEGQSLHMIPVANIIILKHDENYGRRHFLYAYVNLMLCHNNPGYYLNPSETREELADAVLFKFMLTGFPSLYSRYFAKYPGRPPAGELYEMLSDNDIQYIDDIYDLKPFRFRMAKDEQLAFDDEAVLYYAYYFKYLFETVESTTAVDLVDSLFTPDKDRSGDFRRVYREWKEQL